MIGRKKFTVHSRVAIRDDCGSERRDARCDRGDTTIVSMAVDASGDAGDIKRGSGGIFSLLLSPSSCSVALSLVRLGLGVGSGEDTERRVLEGVDVGRDETHEGDETHE